MHIGLAREKLQSGEIRKDNAKQRALAIATKNHAHTTPGHILFLGIRLVLARKPTSLLVEAASPFLPDPLVTIEKHGVNIIGELRVRSIH